MKKRCIVSLTCALMMVIALIGGSCAMETVPEDAKLTKDEVSESTAAVEAQDPSEIIVARVNGREITMESVTKEMNKQASMLRSKNAPTEEETVQMEKNSLDNLIFMDLAAEYGEKKVKVSDDEIDESLSKLKVNIMNHQTYEDYLKEFDYTDETLRKEIEKRLILQKVFQQEVDSKVVVDEEEARKEYDAQKKSFTRPERIEVDIIRIYAGHGREEAMKRAEDITAELREVKKTSELKDQTDLFIETYSISNNENPDLFSMVSGLEPFDVSDIFEKNNSYYFMLVRKKIPEELISFEKAMKWFENRAKKKRAREWFEELKKDAKIEVLLDMTAGKSGNEGMEEKGE